MTTIALTLDPGSPMPLYHQISDQLVAAIEGGSLEKGAFLPSEIELAEQWSVSRPTVRRAIQDLVGRGMLVRRRGVGTQVVTAEVRRKVKLSSLYEDLIDAGRDPTTKVLAYETIVADQDIADELDLETGQLVVYIKRIRSAGSAPLAIMTNWIALHSAGKITADDLERTGLYELLRRQGVQPLIARQVIGAKIASDEEAEMLELTPGSPLVTMRRVMQDQTGRAIELGSHVYDAAQYSVETTVVQST